MFDHSLKIASAALLGCVVVSSCQDYEPNADLIMEKATVHNYEKAFNLAFEKIDPNQNWGFDLMPICGDDVDVTRGSNTNSNQWEDVFHYVVPGGLTPQGVNAPWGQTAGDISNYERAYVYWWFSTHQWPTSLEVNWSDFFIENVWGQPEHSNHTGNSAAYTGTVQLGMDFLEILKKGKDPINTPLVSKITNVTSGLSHGISYNPKNEEGNRYEDVADFNCGGGTLEQVMYLFETSTKDFYHQVSKDDVHPFHNNWTIQYINGEYYLGFDYWCAKERDGHYIEDDYSLIKPDGYYNDWILKLSSGVHTVDSYTRRVMCEDLGNTYDWDFNDLVFDVAIYNGNYGNGQSGYYAQITLQAAGGTLPIYIGQKDQAHEAHSLFGVNTNVPVNVDAPGGATRPAVVFHYPIPDNWVKTTNIQTSVGEKTVYAIDFNNIPIIVDRSSKSESDTYNADNLDPKTGDIVLSAEVGVAPQKFACRTDTYWLKEQKHISTGHTPFAEWVAGQKTEEETFVTSEKVYGNPDVEPVIPAQPALLVPNFYADNGKPYAGSYVNPGQTTVEVIKPWKVLWNEKGDDPQYTAVRSYPKVVDYDGNDYTDKNGYTTYSTTFEAQAPNIYVATNVTENAEEGIYNDPIAYSSGIMGKVINDNYSAEYKPQLEAVWSPNGKKVTVVSNDDSKGYVLGSGYYTYGSDVQITAVPRSGKKFMHWEITGQPGVVSHENPFTIEDISEDKEYTAKFENKPKKNIYFKSIPQVAGYIQNYDRPANLDGWVDLGPFDAGEHVLTALARNGWVFDYWNDNTTDKRNFTTITVDEEDVYITAHFRQAAQYTLTLSVDPSCGSVTGGGTYYEGTQVTAQATPNTGYKFVNWTNADGIVSDQNPYQFNIYVNTELTANFEPIVITISTTQQEGETPPATGTQNQLINGNGTVDEYSNFLASLTSEQGFYQGYELRTDDTGLTGYTECCLEVEYLNGGQITFNNGTDTWLGMESYTPTTGTVKQYAIITISDTNKTLTLQSGADRIRKIVIWVKPKNQ